MMRITRIAGALVVAGLLAVAVVAWADLAVGAGGVGAFEQLAARQGKKQPTGPPPPMVTQGFFGDDIDKIDAACELTDAQKTRLRQMKTELDKAMEKHDKDAAPKLAKIDESLAKLVPNKKDPKIAGARKELEALKAQIAAERENLTQTHIRRMFAVLTSDQKAKWNTPLLTDEMAKEFSIVMLEPKQIERLGAFCAQQARVLAFPVDPFNQADKQLNAVRMQIYKTILTSAQQAEYRQIRNPAPPPPAKSAKGAGKA
jgi:hypothetical protein